LADPFKIRPARLADREAITSLVRELGYRQGPDANIMLWVLNHPEVDVFVAADRNDRAIGFVGLSHRPQLRLCGRITTIDELVVAENWRRRGVGRKLLAAAIERAKALSAKRIELCTHKGRQVFPRAFYERNGFVEIDSAVLRLSSFERSA
jgi:N-acetylglutamate synthase-like GNAT family acetyltransferase